MSTTPNFTRDVALTTIALSYKNPDSAPIADLVAPRVPVDELEFSWQEYPEAEMYTIPDTSVGERTQMQGSEVSGVERQSKCEDKGHQVNLTWQQVQKAKAAFKPRERATMKATNIVILGREKRVSSVVFNPATYDAGLIKVLDGTTGKKKWSDIVNGKPLDDMLNALEVPLVRPNVVTFGSLGWATTRRHPQLVKAAGSSTGEGAITPEQLAELLGVNEVLIGAARANTVKEGKAAALSQLWGPHCSMFFRDRSVDTSGGITFMLTAEFEQRQTVTGKLDVGARGGEYVRTFETVKEVVVAQKAAFFFQDIL